MRIGMMADIYKPHISGVTNYIELNKRYLEARGHEVFVFTFGDEDYQDEETNIIRSPGVPIRDTGFYLNVRYTREARDLIRSMDVAHVHHPFLSGGLALLNCKPFGIPIVFTNHTRYDLYVQAYFPYLPEGVGEMFLKAYLGNFCDTVDLVVAPSPGVERVLRHLGVNAPIEVIPNGVDIAPFRQVETPMERSAFGFSEDDAILVYAGRLGPEKNLPFLLRAFRGAAQAVDNLRLLVVGDGSERDTLEDMARHMGIADRVVFTGMVPYGEIPRYLAMSDLFVTASVTAVHPLSVIEAMAAGLPVLGISSPGIGDTVHDGENGMLVPEMDLAAFTGKLVRLAMDAELRRSLSAGARQSASEYAIENTGERMLQAYEHLVEAAARRDKNQPLAVPDWLKKLWDNEPS